MGGFPVNPFILSFCVNTMYMERERINNLHTKDTVKFCKDVFITTALEINSTNNMSFRIHCCTIWTTFGIVSGKPFIQSFYNVRIMCVVKLMDSFVGNIREEGVLQEILDLSMLLFAPVMIFLTTSISVIFSRLIGKKVFYFTPCTTKLVIIELTLKRRLNSFIEFIKILPPLLLMIPTPIFIEIEGIRHMIT